MRSSFNVLNDPWIPVVEADGGKALLGIRDTLRYAHKLKEISTVSPLEEFSVYRFLCVFLMDAIRPKRSSAITNLLKNGSFDMHQIEIYISTCEAEGVSFDLFDEKRPFMQTTYVEEWDRKSKPISNLDCFLPKGNNHLHFDHRLPADYAIPIEKAARLILSVQQFCVHETQEYPTGVNASPPYFGVVKADNLFETLVFTLLPMQSIDIPFDDPPVLWRSKDAVHAKKEIGQTSWLRGMQFPARRVRLLEPDEDGLVRSVYLSQGENFVNKDNWTDPFVTYRTLKTGRAPLRPKGEKPIWRSMSDIVGISGNHASKLLTQYIRLSDASYAHVTLYGVETSKASYVDVMRHDIRFRTDITESETTIGLLRGAIEAAEKLAKKLRHCLCDDNVVSQKVADNAVARYYGKAEKLFWKLCENCSLETDQAKKQYHDWCENISRYAQEAFDEALEQVSLRGKALAKAAEQQKWLAVEINKIKEAAKV